MVHSQLLRIARRLQLPLSLMLWMHGAAPGLAANNDGTEARLAGAFSQSVLPLVKKYCLDCHGPEQPEAMFDLSAYRDLKAVSADHPHWGLVLQRLEANEMPPADADPQPTSAKR